MLRAYADGTEISSIWNDDRDGGDNVRRDREHRNNDVPEPLRQAARNSTNFGRLYRLEPLLSIYGSQAEQAVFANPNASYVSAGQFGEVLAEELVRRLGLRVNGDRQIDRLEALDRVGALPGTTRRAFDALRRGRNDAAHNHLFDTTKALEAVQTCFQLGDFFLRAVEGVREVAAFVPPRLPDVESAAELDELREALASHRATLIESRTRLGEVRSKLEAEQQARAEAENLIAAAERARAEAAEQAARYRIEVEALHAEQQRRYDEARRNPRKIAHSARDAIVQRAQSPAPLNEVQARTRIDELLTAAGWIVQNRDELNPDAGTGIAVREFPVATGRADYVLYVNGRIVGVIEAKREGTPLAGALAQNEQYAAGVLKEHSMAVWNQNEPFVFRYATTGTETYFLNRIDPHARSREVFAFHRPDTFATWMQRAEENPDAPTYRAALRTRVPQLESHGLRLAQVEAIAGLESSLADDRPRALIQMATGAGKTFTAVTESYRLLKHAGARRILFLVDRNNLGRQARASFDRYITPEENRKFTDLYNVDVLGSAGLQDTSSVVISTIQRMYSLLKGERLDDSPAAADMQEVSGGSAFDESYESDAPVGVEYNSKVPIESFDVIVIDECHRSIYGLWRGVLEYFDAHLVGLTATPTPQTKGFFNQNMVSEYTYPQAVADNVNVDFDVVRVNTDLRENGGAKIEKGTTVKVLDRATREKRLEELEDDFTYTTSQLGRTVITPDEIRAVLVTYRDNWRRWFPGRAEIPKTLIFAAGDHHAEDVIKEVKEVFSRGDDFAKKITYRSRDNGEDPDQLINDLRNSALLRVAVTVDMIATGTDIQPLEVVIFLRDVKSPTLFEQMKGRGARTIDPEDLKAVTPEAAADLTKDRFIMIDAVGVTDSPLVDARPLASSDSRGLSLQKLMDKAGSRSLTADQAGTLARRLARVNRQLDKDQQQAVEAQTGGVPLTSIVRAITDAADVDSQDQAYRRGGAAEARRLIHEAISPLTTNPELRKTILRIRHNQDLTYDEVTEVTVTEVVEVPRKERSRVELEHWRELLEEEQERARSAGEEAALQVILGSGVRHRPEAARAYLKNLETKIKAGNAAWTTAALWGKYEDLGKTAEPPGKNAGIGDLMNLIRYELGVDDTLRPYHTVVEARFENWLERRRQAGADFTDDQLWYLERIMDVIAVGVGVERADFNSAPFTERGGGRGFVNAFGGQPDKALELLDELNRDVA
ncbi:DEAD/DEAH box helicase family protein [Streptomyces sp. NPDC048370]|uniref:type I restriction endonuclease subunit R n=1 Tax=Streptomyces sp. NPDC048370 TaxID=3365540 RepID=UPI00372267DA